MNIFSSDFKTSNGEPDFEDNLVSGITIDLYIGNSSDLLKASYSKAAYDNISKSSLHASDITVNYNFENGEVTTNHITYDLLKVYNASSNY